jgi:hypothetical protein
MKVSITPAMYDTLIRGPIKGLHVGYTITDPDGLAHGGGGSRGHIYTQWCVWDDEGESIPLLECDTKYDIEYVTRMGQLVAVHTDKTELYFLHVNKEPCNATQD